MILYQYMDLKYLSSCFENGVYASKLEKSMIHMKALGSNIQASSVIVDSERNTLLQGCNISILKQQ